jgi:hypothetical protein
MNKVFVAHLYLVDMRMSEIMLFSKSPTTEDMIRIVQSRVQPSHVPDNVWNAIQKERAQMINEGRAKTARRGVAAASGNGLARSPEPRLIVIRLIGPG